MPRIGQIIPEYLVPHVKTYINDNTEFVEEVSAADPSLRFLCIFTSNRGEDSGVKKIRSTTAFVDEYGTPDYEHHGQGALNAYAALRSGYGSCWCLRITDKELATYANMILYAETKMVQLDEQVKDADGNIVYEKDGEGNPKLVDGEPVPKLKQSLEVRFKTTSYEGIREIDGKRAIDVLNEKMVELGTVVEGEPAKYPIFGAVLKGSGKYGNSYALRIVPDYVTANNVGYVTYTVQEIDKSSGAVIAKDQHVVSFDTASIGNATTVYADDVINDPETGSTKISIVCGDGLNKIYEDYNYIYNENMDEGIPDFNKCDLMFGKTVKEDNDLVELSKYRIILPDDDTATVEDNELANLSGVSGFAFANGSDGRFDPDYVYPAVMSEDGNTVVTPSHTITADERSEVMINAYLSYLDVDKKLVPALFSKRRTPAEFILDAAFPDTVKDALVKLALHRYDAQLVLDAGIKLIGSSDVINWSTGNLGYGTHVDPIVSKECQHYKIRDPFTSRIIDVSYTYYLAQTLPVHFMTIGNHIPFVGQNYSTLTGHIRNSVLPEIDADDLKTKEELYKHRINFVECIGEDLYIHGVQNTAQKKWSDLSEINNMAVLLDMKRKLEDYVSSKLYNFADPEDRQRFTDDAERMFMDYTGNKLREYSVYFDMNEYEAERSILHCYLSVVFRQLAKRGIIEIDINKRTN